MSHAAKALTARETARRIAAGDLTAEAAVRLCLEAVAAREPAVGAWHVLGAEQALEAARAVDRAGGAAGPLGGVPIAVKDNIDTAGLPTGYGSAIYEGHRPAADAACVVAAEAAGAIVLGKTVTTEFAYYNPGKTANPHNIAHTPGGSSQGSAAAVAAGMVPLGFGTQTAGSVVRPAAYCGVVGFKPSWGLIPRGGVKVLSDWLDTVGVFAGDVEDAAFFVAALTGRPNLRPQAPASGLRVTVLRPPYPEAADADALAALDRAASALRAAGHHVADLPMPEILRSTGALQRLVMGFDMSRSLAHERREHEDRLSPVLRRYLDEGATVTPEAYDAAMASVRALQADMGSLFGEADVLLSPAAPGEAPLGLAATGDPAFNRLWTLLQMPALTVPTGVGGRGLPLGVQVSARPGQDGPLLAAALALERALAASR